MKPNAAERREPHALTFTEKRLRDLPYAEVREVYLDTEQPGLQLRVTATRKVFLIRYRKPGANGSERFTLGEFPKLHVEEARRIAREKLGEVAAAKDPAGARRALRGEMRVGQLADRYFQDRRSAGKRRVDDTRAIWDRWVGSLPDEDRKPHGRLRAKPEAAVDWTNKRLSEIAPEQVEALHKRITAASGGTIANRVVEIVRAMFNFAQKKRLATDNPARSVTMQPEQSRSRFLKPGELKRFLEAVRKEDQPWRDYFTVLLYLGYRKSAVAAMKWSDIELARATWTVPGERAKNGDPIVLAIHGDALRVLTARHKDRHRDHTWVFPGESLEGHITAPKKAWARVLKRARIDGLRIHDLRRTLGSYMAMSGKSLLEIGRALGHKDPRSTEVYAHLTVDAARLAVASAHDAMRKATRRAGAAK